MAGETVEPTEFNGEIAPEVEVDGVLPSDEPKVVESDDWVKENTSENGKLFGQFDDMQSALEHYRKQEVTHTNNMRDIKNEQKSKQEEGKSIQADLQAEQTRQDTLVSISTSLTDNSMQFTDEMITELETAGISQAEAKVVAYEAKETIEANYTVLGGKEAYDETMEFGATIYDEAQQASIMNSIKNNQVSPEFRELALLGLKAKMGGEITPTRVAGRSANEPSVAGYTDFSELSKDRQASKRDPSVRAKYLKKLSLTDDKVLSLYG